MLWITWNKLFVSVEYIASLAPACFWCLILFSPHQYPETRGYQSCGSLLHPRAQDLFLYARHWSGQSLLHLWSCLKHEEKNVYIYVLHDTTHTHARTQAPLSLLRKQSAHHASRASERVLTANVYMESLTVQKDTPSYIQTQVQQDFGGWGWGVPFQKKKKKSNFLELALVSLEVWARLVNKGRVLNHCQSM